MASPLEGSDTVRHTYTHVAICKASGTQSLDYRSLLALTIRALLQERK